jgi:DHA1 family bicyclomycin/chloramphenicol resistance-like MFS transporter
MAFASDHGTDAHDYRSLNLVSYFLFAVGPLVGNAVLVLLGAVSSDFMTDPTVVLIAIPAFMFPFAFIQLFSGALSDIYGRIPVILGGLVGFALGLFVTAYSTSLLLFLLGNFVCGVGFGFVNPVLLALLSDFAAHEDIPKRMGIAAALASLSVGLGPFIAGQMVILGWQSYYLMFLVIVVLSSILLLLVKRPAKVVHDDSGLRILIKNMRSELQRPPVLMMLVATLLLSLSYLGVLIWASRGLAGVFNESTIGFLLLGGGISGAVAGSLIGILIRKYGYSVPTGIAFLVLLAGLAVFILLGDITTATPVGLLLFGLAAAAWGGGLLFPMMITYSQVISPEHRGVLAGIVTFAYFLGSALIPIVYEPFFAVGLTWVFIAILGDSILLLVVLVSLNRMLRSHGLVQSD